MSRGWTRGVAYVSRPPLWWCCVQGAYIVCCFCSQHPIFCSWLFRSGSWFFLSFCIFLSIICPNSTCMQLFLVPYNSIFFFFFAQGGVYPGASIAVRGPRSQPISEPFQNEVR